MHSKSATLLFFLLIATAMAAVACSGDSDPGSSDGAGSGSDPSSATSTSVRPTRTPPPSPTREPVLKHPEIVLDLEQGDFWEFRWEFIDQSCAQGSGCSTREEGGNFTVTLGEPQTISGVEMFTVRLSGEFRADKGAVNLAPGWKFIGADETQLYGSDGFSLVTIFDALDGQWVGGGFFSRFIGSESHATGLSTVQAQPFAQWPGVLSGPLVSVARSDSETMCELIEGRRICPRDQAFSLSESQFYQKDVGPMGYTYGFSASFSGGGFFSSSSSQENVVLVASSLRLDSISPTPTPAIDLDVHFEATDGSLTLVNINNQIPDFSTGVDLLVGVVDVTFVNPDVGGTAWSYGITFRQSEEETFHAVYVTGSGQWQHFSRGGTAESQVSTALSPVAMNLEPGAENRLIIVVNIDTAAFFVNGELVAELDLSTTNARVSGDVRVMAGVLSTDVYNGARSEFYDLTVLAP